MTTFVLVPGFWLGAWAWEEVAADLRADGHQVHPVTLAGVAERAGEATPDIDVEAHVADLIRIIEEGDLRDVVLVGHSGAILPITGALDRIPERLRQVVYVDAGPLPYDMAQIDFTSPEEQEATRRQVAEEGDGWLIPVPAFDPVAGPAIHAGLTEEHLATMRRRGTPQPFGTAGKPLDPPADRRPGPRPPAAVIACTFTPEQVRQLISSGNRVFALMADMEVHHLPTGHWPMFSRPHDFAALLSRIAP